MTERKKKRTSSAGAARASNGTAKKPASHPRTARSRQRQHLIDACISALHLYGPSRTTVEKVVDIARMSPGIVRFYFDSKAAMLVASLQFLALEFEERVMVPVAQLEATPVAALERLVELYLDPEIASPRKVSVWYAFWGEASSRQEYYDICGQKDEGFASLVQSLVGRLVAQEARPHLDAGGVALGLIGALEISWQEIAFQNESDVDRRGARRRCRAYLQSVFPGRFLAAGGGAELLSTVDVSNLPAWAYRDGQLFSQEREALFAGSWQLAGHESQIARNGEFVATELAAERVLLIRDASGIIRGLRNSCPIVPHVLVTEECGSFTAAIDCKLHGVAFDWSGCSSSSRAADLPQFAVSMVAGLIFVMVGPSRALPGRDDSLPKAVDLDLMELSSEPLSSRVAADWKVVVEQWLATAAVRGQVADEANSIEWPVAVDAERAAWSAARYANLLGAPDMHWRRRFVMPNHLFEFRPDGFAVLQVVPTAPGASVIHRYDLSRFTSDRRGLVAQYLVRRIASLGSRAALAVAESAQRGIVEFGYPSDSALPEAPALAWWLQSLRRRLPALGTRRPLAVPAGPR